MVVGLGTFLRSCSCARLRPCASLAFSPVPPPPFCSPGRNHSQGQQSPALLPSGALPAGILSRKPALCLAPSPICERSVLLRCGTLLGSLSLLALVFETRLNVTRRYLLPLFFPYMHSLITKRWRIRARGFVFWHDEIIYFRLRYSGLLRFARKDKGVRRWLYVCSRAVLPSVRGTWFRRVRRCKPGLLRFARKDRG